MSSSPTRYSISSGLVAVLWLAMPSGACAGPTFEWQNYFGVRLDRRFEGDGQGFASAAFGASAIQDGQITDTGAAGDHGAATAVARARSMGTAYSLIALADANVFFWRTFQLSNAADGWKVSLDGFLKGVLSVQIAAPTSVQGKVRLVAGSFSDYSENPAGIVTIDFGSQRIQENEETSIDSHLTSSSVVADGTYTVMGALWTSAHINYGTGDARFFDSPGMTATIDAAAIANPEPSTLVLLGTGALGWICWQGRRWRRV
jgi:hypothetical protein